MKFQSTITALILAMVSSAGAQLATSHAPTLPAAQSRVAQLPSSMQVTGRPVARVNGVVLTDRDLLREMLDLFPYARLHNGFPKEQEAEIRRGAYQMIIFEELVYQEAQRRKMTIAPERVTAEEKKFRKEFSSQAEFNNYLKSESDGSEAKLRQKIKRSLLIEAMLKAEVTNKSVVSLSEARLYYQKNLKAYEHGEIFAIQTISILPPATANPETLKEVGKNAEAVLAKAKMTKSYEQFGVLAENVSDDDYHVNMGDHKMVKSGDLPKEVVNALRAMKPGEMSGLIQLGTAYTIVRLNAHALPGKWKFEEVKVELTEKLHKQKYENLRVALGKRLRQNAKIEDLS